MARLLITVPVWNEEVLIVQNLRTLIQACTEMFPQHDWMIEVADNGSTDRTAELVAALAESQPRVRLRRASGRGKGLAIRESWLGSDSDVFCFTDADLAADIRQLPALIEPILSGQADVVCGSRYLGSSKVSRSRLRELVSRLYRIWQKFCLDLSVEDAQCGFKAVSARTVKEIVPLLREKFWLFDSELLALARRRGLIIHELAVDWIEHRDVQRRSTIHLWKDGWGFIYGVWRIRRRVHKLSTGVS